MEKSTQDKSLDSAAGDDDSKKEGKDPEAPQAPQPDRKGDKFEPVDIKNTTTLDTGLPPEIWTLVQSAPANFTPHYFLEVSRNLLENPNLTASHLSRAELSYQSFTDASFNPEAKHPHELARIVKHLKADHQPILVDGGRGVGGYKLEWTVVRKLIPRNPKLDESLLQTCHMFTSTQEIDIEERDGTSKTAKVERYLIIYIPHATDPEKIPFYHPKVRGLAILYAFRPDAPTEAPLGALSLYYDLFPNYPLDNRLTRTALKMLEIIHKHSRGRMAGYQKRVYHDIIIAQKPFQDTYVYLKGKYAKGLIDGWVEQTPPEKHVFEDLGIAAFLIELWTEMYGGKPTKEGAEGKRDIGNINGEEKDEVNEKRRRTTAQSNFPGFVDVGCGNGLLVYLLNEEGWHGWGFDARRRKTWATFGASYAEKLKEMLLIPSILNTTPDPEPPAGESEQVSVAHNGIFPQGTFIIANHADELTIWTPLLAMLSSSPFLAIPCCSHNFGGTRFRAPNRAHSSSSTSPSPSSTNSKKTLSAYATFCTYTEHVAELMGFKAEKEFLRIPSTRNIAILGRERGKEGKGDIGDMMEFVKGIVETEMGVAIEEVRRLWVERGSGLMKPGKGDGH